MKPVAKASFTNDDLSKLLLELPALPYLPLRRELYTPDELNRGFDGTLESTADHAIFRHFTRNGRFAPTLGEALAQRLHDWSIDEALRAFIRERQMSIVAIMGGHSQKRGTSEYREVALLAYQLTRRGHLIATGGGPGIMEAANLGAFLASSPELEAVDEAIAMLSPFPHFLEPEYYAAANRVRERFGPGSASLAIPTWFYGHEPTSAFGTHVAKYFSNGLREDTLLAIAWGGVVYAPGKAGTWQEIFMDLAQNYYATYPVLSPMVFLGREHYERDTQIAPLVARLTRHSRFAEKLSRLFLVADTAEEILAFLAATPPESPDMTISAAARLSGLPPRLGPEEPPR